MSLSAVVALLLIGANYAFCQLRAAESGAFYTAHFSQSIQRKRHRARTIRARHGFVCRTNSRVASGSKAALRGRYRERPRRMRKRGAGMRRFSLFLRSYGIEHDPDGQSRIWGAAKRALSLNPGLAEPHAVLGFFDYFWGDSHQAAEEEFKIAIALDKASATAVTGTEVMLTYDNRYGRSSDPAR